jgi:regulator of nucleoside diphosphate kinase
MQTISQPALAESLSGIWYRLHADVPFTIDADETHYLTAIALALDDDIVSRLLLKKIRLAQAHEGRIPAQPAVRMNSFVDYRFNGRERRLRQLVHPTSSARSHGLSVASREGAGVLGMRPGQTILWPDEEGTLADLHVLHVERPPRLRGRGPLGTTDGARDA